MNHAARLLLLVAIMIPVCVLLSGCGEAKRPASAKSGVRYNAEQTPNASVQMAQARDDGTFADAATTADQTKAAKAPGQAAGLDDKSPTPRKVIYNATVNLVVEDFESVRNQVGGLVQKFGGFVANSNVQGTAGSSRSGTWTVRIPVAQYGGFVDAVSALGKIENVNTTSREVTEEYYDVEARVRNKQKEEERLLSHLKEHTAKLEEILTVEREISRVREEIERLQGRMRVLTDLTDLTTVTLQIQERTKFTPVANTPTFGTRIRETFGGTMEVMQAVGQALVLLFVAAGPWMVVLAIPAVLIYAILRRRFAKPPTATT